MSTLQQKALISLGSAALFAAVTLPKTYEVTNKLFKNTYNVATSCATSQGRLLHTLVFFILTFLSMGDPRVNSATKLKHTIYGTLIFFLVSSPAMFSFTSSVFGSKVASPGGCPTLLGVLLHALVYAGVLIAVMYLP